jgi:hypothetical protein
MCRVLLIYIYAKGKFFCNKKIYTREDFAPGLGLASWRQARFEP